MGVENAGLPPSPGGEPDRSATRNLGCHSPAPQERVRRRLAAALGTEAANSLPRGYQRLQDVLLLRLPPEASEFGPLIGKLYQEEMGVATVLAMEGVAKGPFREPRVRVLAGERTETTVRDAGISWAMDAAHLLFSAGNMEERHRVARLVQRGERVADLFAGIGYFSIPAAKLGGASQVHAVERNPLSFSYLKRNILENGVGGRVVPWLGDNRQVALSPQSFDRVFLGYLPSAVPFVGRALELLVPTGGWLHVHTVISVRAPERALGVVSQAIRRAGGEVGRARLKRVKSYGPARDHVVVDAWVERD